TRSTTRMVVVKAGPLVVVPRLRRGARTPKAPAPARTRLRTSTSSVPATLRRLAKNGPLLLERPVCRRVSAQEGRRRSNVGPQGCDQDLVASFHHPAAVCRSDLRRPQRPKARAGDGQRRHG